MFILVLLEPGDFGRYLKFTAWKTLYLICGIVCIPCVLELWHRLLIFVLLKPRELQGYNWFYNIPGLSVGSWRRRIIVLGSLRSSRSKRWNTRRSSPWRLDLHSLSFPLSFGFLLVLVLFHGFLFVLSAVALLSLSSLSEKTNISNSSMCLNQYRRICFLIKKNLRRSESLMDLGIGRTHRFPLYRGIPCGCSCGSHIFYSLSMIMICLQFKKYWRKESVW